MSGSAQEEVIRKVIEKYGRDAEAPAREVAQVYEDEMRRLESQYRELEQAAVDQDRKAANSIKSVAIGYFVIGLGLGTIAATVASQDLFISAIALYLFGAVMCGVGGLISFI